MALNNIRLGDYIYRTTLNNRDLKYDESYILGVTSDGIFSKPRGSLLELDLQPYKLVYKGAFVYNPSRLNIGSIAYFEEEFCIVSHLYIIFYLNDLGRKIIDPYWLYIYLRRLEFQREVSFRNFGSQRPEFNFNDISDIIIPLPDLPTQEKYVNIYFSMLENQKSYEQGLEDLKLVCDGYINSLSKDFYKPLSDYIVRNTTRNESNLYDVSYVKGFNNDGEFIKPMRLFSGDINSFKIISNNYFVYNSRINSTIDKLSIALNEGDNLLVSPAYESFYIKNDEELFPYYLYMLLQRESFGRKVLFNSFGSSTIVFGIDNLGEIEVPVINIDKQKAISNIYKLYKKRKEINEKLKQQIKDICPILIKGAIEEAKEA